jgi:hypothetical protein
MDRAKIPVFLFSELSDNSIVSKKTKIFSQPVRMYLYLHTIRRVGTRDDDADFALAMVETSLEKPATYSMRAFQGG